MIRLRPVVALLLASLLLALVPPCARAAQLTMASGATGRDIAVLRAALDRFEAQTGHTVRIIEMPSSSTDEFAQYRLWLAAGNRDVDVYRTDIIWAPQIANHLLDLSAFEPARLAARAHFPNIIDSQTVDGRLVALPYYTDVPALFYRRDLLDRYGLAVPETWDDLVTAARAIQAGERAAGADRFHGYVFQAASYEGLTCNGLEWLAAAGAGELFDTEGRPVIDIAGASAVLTRVASWIGDITPQGVLAWREEESRGIWQTGHAAFMRNWPYAAALSSDEGSAVKGRFGIAPLPAGTAGSAATLGGWNLAVSRYSREPDAAVDLVRFLSSAQAQKDRAIANNNLPTIPALYTDPQILAVRPDLPIWKRIVDDAIARPSARTGRHYNEFSKEFWSAVHATLSGRDDARRQLVRFEARMKRLQRGRRR